MSDSDEGSSAHGDASREASLAASPSREHDVEETLEDEPELTPEDALAPLTQHTSNADSVRDFASMEKKGGR